MRQHLRTALPGGGESHKGEREHSGASAWSYGLCCLIVVVLTAVGGPASADKATGVLSLRRFELLDAFAGGQQSEELNSYLAGVADSLSLANVYLEAERKPRLFCAYKALTVSELRGILRERTKWLAEIGQNNVEAKERIGVVTVLIQRLREKFPCR